MTLQRRLAMHGSAVLLRRKPAALLSLPQDDLRDNALQDLMNAYALSHLVLRARCSRCDGCAHALVLIYNAQLLQACVQQPEAKRALLRLGYPMNGTLSQVIARLYARVQGQAEFPHEVGFFLGYPVEDVLGFMRHRGKHYKLCGPWKVYSDVPRAMAMFQELVACRAQVLHHIESGGSLFDLPQLLAG